MPSGRSIHVGGNRLYGKYMTSAKFNCRLRRYYQHILYGTTAKLTDEIIDPAVYEEDLYGVLDCSRNASKTEIKEAYWKIAMVSHPDRNSTPDAMYVFRNASRAYSILGRDEKLRAEYDSKYNTMKYLSALEDYGSEVVIPLARDVAVPLINITVQSIGSFAKPFFRDAFEQSTAVYNAAFRDGTINEATALGESTVYSDEVQAVLDKLDIFTRTSLAIEKTSYDQKLRSIRENMLTTAERLALTVSQIADAEKLEEEIGSSLKLLELIETDAINNAVFVDGKASNAKTVFFNASSTEKAIDVMLTKQLDDIENARSQKERNDVMLKLALDEVKVLEEQLNAAKGRANQYQVDGICLTDMISSSTANSDILRAQLLLATVRRTDVESIYITNQQEKDIANEQANIATSNTSAARVAYARHIDYKKALDRKVSQLNLKRTTLDSVLEKTLSEKKSFDIKIQKIKQEKIPDSKK